ncbi:MAG: SDR family oxidoreductase [Rhodocyclaceae bacterium]|nr:SDR family oxidoreductase [Rhodocyclaceae bacterium]MCB1912534.1 SDR family oxidoreductase [Rhodocyclaceae bacterium]MCP5233067.1 SDR family oxidoreductase [Zoogloeaceae bacterium]MCW5616229.1 SDR family oxidoreductase [Rhodocyclaceae bacterium]HQV08754.1 SDR family oxidoreductase [Thauera sp.]
MSDAAAAVLITGASSGIGAALARAYAKRGARLGLLGRREKALAALCESLPGEHLVLVADVGDPLQMAEAARRFVSRFGIPDVVIANAGVSVGTLTEYASDLTAFEKVLRTNLLGMVSTFQPFVEPMRQRRSGRLVGIASVAGIRGLPGVGAYSASKAAVINYLESLRVEMHGSGVKVVTVAPGYIRTPMTDVNDFPMPFLMAPDAAAAQILRMVDAGRRYGVLPWQMALVARLLRMVPRPLFDRVFARAGRKPRGLLR